MIAIADYGVGNLFSLVSSLRSLGLAAAVTKNAAEIRAAERVILPGVGAFGGAAALLQKSGLGAEVVRAAQEGKPVLGVCLGMQLLFEKSSEYGEHKGLGLLRGSVQPIPRVSGLKIPHMGWNSLHFVQKSPLFRYVEEGEYVYFVHSYRAVDCENSLIAVAEHGVPIAAAVGKGNVFGTQFHPEKSGDTGLRILKAFAQL